MNVTRVWNISDHPGTKVQPRTIMIFGKPCAPGRYVLVNDVQLKNAHKLEAEVKAKMLYVGDQPPDDYVAARKPARAPLAKGAARAHGQVPVEAIRAEAPAVIDSRLSEEPPVVVVESGEESGDSHRRRRRG